MRIDILTLFPAIFEGPFTESILKRAQENGLIEIRLHNIRDYTTDKHHITDEPPYGGGGGMVLKVKPVIAAVEAVLADQPGGRVILTTPQGRRFNQALARELAAEARLVFICGHYEGIDERVLDLVVSDPLSIGDYVLTGGELPAAVMVDAIVRYIPGVLGAPGAAESDSHATGLLEYAQYTRPPVFRGLEVPPLLQGGNHIAIEKFRRQESIRRTWQHRPDLLLEAPLSDAEKYELAALAEAWIDAHADRNR